MAGKTPQLLNFSRTERIVFVIDLHPILTVQNPAQYITAVIAAAERILRFDPLSESLFAYRFFLSSVSPIKLADLIPGNLCSPSLSFNRPFETLAAFSRDLNSNFRSGDLANLPGSSQCMKHTASSLLQLIHDYAWDGDLLGKDRCADGEFANISSNLVLLFSPVNCIIESIGSDCSDVFLAKFEEIFGAVKGAFVSRDIHLCWIDVKSNDLGIGGVNQKKVDDNEYEAMLAIFEDGIRKMGWAFCSSDLIVLGSALLPLGLIYPKIGVSSNFVEFDRICKGQLNLEISDVKGKPLECKFCDLEFMKLKSSRNTIKYSDVFDIREPKEPKSEAFDQDSFLSRLGDCSIKVHVKSVHKHGEFEKIGGLSEYAFVRELSEESGKSRKKSSVNFFADKVLEMLHKEMGGVTCRSQIPIWQIFLSFLHTNGFSALVSLSNTEGHTFIGNLKPFTSHIAIFSITDHSLFDIGKFPNTCAEELNDSNGCFGSQTDSSTPNNELREDLKRKKSERQMHKQMTWESFYKAALEGSYFDLLEVFVARNFDKSKLKKLKFLKCWTKQIEKIDPSFSKTLHESKSIEELPTSHSRIFVPSQVEEESTPASNLETPESFFNNLSDRIQHGLESEIDLQNLAERVVKSSIYWLHHKQETENNVDLNDSCSETVDQKLTKLLLRKPNEMKKIHQDSSDTIVREYELQIFLRLEIIKSKEIVGSKKKKLLKQICSLLEIIQYLVAGGIHGNISLFDYIERTIKARYLDELEDVVEKIYTKMDLLPFGDEVEAPSLAFNSDDSNASWRDKHEKQETSQPLSTEDGYSQSLTNADEYPLSLKEACERRERSRRFVSFTSRVPDLQRVWAPKLTAIKAKSDPHVVKCKRKHRGSGVVHETPMRGKSEVSRDKEDSIGNSSYSVSKALFQDSI